MTVACILAMEKTSAPKPPPIEAQPRSCNDFVVASAGEKRFVEGACKLTSSYKGWAYKIAHNPCDTTTAFAICHVPDKENPDAFIDTFYYTPSQITGNNVSPVKLFEEDCRALAGEFERVVPSSAQPNKNDAGAMREIE
jgi:hypothetical protein